MDEERKTGTKRFRRKPSALFDCVKAVYDWAVTPSMLRQSFYACSTQKNESWNKEVATVAPKDKTFSLTWSMSDRVDFVVLRGTLRWYLPQAWNAGVPVMTEEFLRREGRHIY